MRIPIANLGCNLHQQSSARNNSTRRISIRRRRSSHGIRDFSFLVGKVVTPIRRCHRNAPRFYHHRYRRSGASVERNLARYVLVGRSLNRARLGLVYSTLERPSIDTRFCTRRGSADVCRWTRARSISNVSKKVARDRSMRFWRPDLAMRRATTQ